MLYYRLMKKQRNSTTFILLLLIGDILAILGAYSFAYIFRVKLSDDPVANFIAAEPYFLSLVSLTPFIILFLALAGTYRINSKTTISQIIKIIIGALVAMLSLVTIDYFLNEPLFPAKLVPVYGFGISIALLALVRIVLYAARWLWWRKESNLQSVIIVGGEYAARDLAADIKRRNSGYTLLGVVGDQRFSFTTHKTLEDALEDAGEPNIIIQVASKQQPTIDEVLLDYAHRHFIEFKFVPNDSNEVTNLIELELFMGEIPVMAVNQTTLTGWGRLFKRAFDVIVSLTALILLSPVFLIVAIINKLVLGKVFFHHTRITRGDQPFEMYKFQTVRNDLNGLTPEEAFRKIGKPELIKQYRDGGDYLPNDPRYGAWGNFSRKASLDELPQLFNVLRGDISLVGPRALIPQEINAYANKHAILNVKSGVTGLAQVSGRRDLPWEQRRKLDVYYAQHWSFGLDVKILFSTAGQVLSMIWQMVSGRKKIDEVQP